MAAVLRLVPDSFREFFLLERAQREVSSRSADQETRIREFLTAADARLAAAESLTGADQVPAALILYRDGVIFAIRALLEARGRDSSEQTAEGAMRTLAAMIEAGEVPAAPPGFESARALLSDRRPLAFDELSSREGHAKRAEIETMALWLRGLVDARSVRQIKWSRGLRIGIPVLLMLALL